MRRRDADGRWCCAHCLPASRGEGAGAAVAVLTRHLSDRLPGRKRFDGVVKTHALTPHREPHVQLALKQARESACRSARRRGPIVQCPFASRVGEQRVAEPAQTRIRNGLNGDSRQRRPLDRSVFDQDIERSEASAADRAPAPDIPIEQEREFKLPITDPLTKPPLPIAARRRGGRLRRAIAV